MNSQMQVAPTTSPRLEKFFSKVAPVRARLIFGLDATASRQETWDIAGKLTADMFAAASGLNLQLVYFRGIDEFKALPWTSDSVVLARKMSEITCRTGMTKIERVLRHTHGENLRERVNALVIVSDACEENPADLFDAAHGLRDTPCFLFQEGRDPHITDTYAEIAKITNGAVANFDAGAASRLKDLLKAVAAFASGGMKALAAQRSAAATLLLTQMKR